MNDILTRQIAIDYCCTPEQVLDERNHFTEHRFLEGRRRFREKEECFLKLAVINGKLLFCGRKDIIEWCGEAYAEEGAEWFMEAKSLRRLNDRLHQDGYQIGMIHPFFIPEGPSRIDPQGVEIRRYHGEEIEQFRGDDRYSEAFTFCEEAPDVIGVAAVSDGKILGMAGASADSPTMWQIGINVDPSCRKAGVAKTLVALLKNEILQQGILPYYGTGFSHLASQRVALGTGFMPAWVELFAMKIGE